LTCCDSSLRFALYGGPWGQDQTSATAGARLVAVTPLGELTHHDIHALHIIQVIERQCHEPLQFFSEIKQRRILDVPWVTYQGNEGIVSPIGPQIQVVLMMHDIGRNCRKVRSMMDLGVYPHHCARVYARLRNMLLRQSIWKAGWRSCEKEQRLTIYVWTPEDY